MFMLALVRQIIRVRDPYPVRSATSRAPLAFWEGMAWNSHGYCLVAYRYGRSASALRFANPATKSLPIMPSIIKPM